MNVSSEPEPPPCGCLSHAESSALQQQIADLTWMLDERIKAIQDFVNQLQLLVEQRNAWRDRALQAEKRDL